MARTLAQIDTPALVLDRTRLERNIARMRERTAALGVALRPHMKTTKSADIARRVAGAGITVSTLREAEYFAAHGHTDIFYAVAIAPQKLERAATLMRGGVRLLLAVDDVAIASLLARRGGELGVSFEALIEIDSGEGRSGIEADDDALLQIAAALAPGARVAGVFTHGGHSYSGRSTDEHAAVAEQERSAVVRAAERLRGAGHACAIVSIGSTPSAIHARALPGVSEVRAGVYMLGDLFQAGIGGCAQDDIAVSVLATVIGSHPRREQLVIDAGSLALSKDLSTRALGVRGDAGYGLVADADSGEVIDGLYVHVAYQEHGIVRSRGAPIDYARFAPGRRLRILPNHACLTSAAYDRYHVVAGDSTVEAEWPRIGGW